MKRSLLFLLFTFLLSCSESHFHDGVYKATVFNDATLSWVHTEIISINGNEMTVKNISVVDNKIISEYKTSCIQFEDRVEFKGKDGLTIVVRFDTSGNMKYGGYTYKKNNENMDVINNEKKPVSLKEETNPQINEKGIPFQGTKKFTDGIGWIYLVTIDGNSILFKLYPSQENHYYKDKETPREVISGKIKDGEIITDKSSFKFENGKLYELNNEDAWNEYYELN